MCKFFRETVDLQSISMGRALPAPEKHPEWIWYGGLFIAIWM
jgi:hypothetical protein